MRRLGISTVLLLMEARELFAQGCAMCGQFDSADPTGRAISWSVLYLMSMPYLLAGLVASVFFVAYRRARMQTSKGELA